MSAGDIQEALIGPRPTAALRQTAGLLWAARDKASMAWLAIAGLAVTLGGLVAALGPLALANLVDGLAAPQNRRGHELGLLIGAYVGAVLLQRLCEQAQAFAYGRGEQRLIRTVSTGSFEHMLRLPMDFHLSGRSGALGQTLTDGAVGLRLILFHLVMTLAPAAVQLAAVTAVVSHVFDARVGVVLLIALGAYAGVFAMGVARQAGAARGASAAQIDAGGLAADGLMNIEAVKTFTAEPRMAARYDSALADRERQWRDFLAHRFGNGLAVAAVFGAMLGATLLLVVLTPGRPVSVGGFVLINTYVLQLVRPLEMLGFAARDIGQGLAYLSRLLDIRGQAPEGDVSSPSSPRQASSSPAHLAFDAVSFRFTPERATLDKVSFDIPAGAFVGVVGPSGAGKSSLLRLILRLYDPAAGEIRLDGVPLATFPLAELRDQIAVVSQDTILFNDTIAQNIALAASAAGRDQIEAAAAAARLSDLVSRLPQGLETPVGERGLKLSGGEKQRVAIARAALKRARLVLYDEATAALDPTTEQAVWQALGELAQGATTLVVTHRLATVAKADQILVLDHGRLVERGRHEALLAANGAYARLWRAQVAETATET